MFTYVANWIKWFASFFITTSSGDKITVGVALLTAGIGLITFTVTTTTTTAVFFGLITKGESVQTTPYVALGWFVLGLAAIFIAWGVFFTPAI